MTDIKSLHVEQYGVISCVHLATPEQDTLDYLPCEAALGTGGIEIREVSDAGDVNAIEVVSELERFVFMMDGDILEGAKQTRVLNTSVFLAPKSRTVVPVSCVEQGRWRYTSRSFRGSGRVAPRNIRAAKSSTVSESLRRRRRHDADQRRVWDEVSEIDARHAVHSPSLSLSDTYVHLEKDLDALVGSFKGHPDANGFAILVGGQLLGVDIFNRRDVCAAYLSGVLRAVAIEAVHLEGGVRMPKPTEASFRAVDFLDRLAGTTTERHRGVALGEEQRFDTPLATGFTLEYDRQLVHETVMVLEKTGG